MIQQSPATVYYSNGGYLIFSAEHAIHLRRERILSRPVTSCGDAGSGFGLPPYCISPYAAMVVARQGIAQFKRLEMKREISVEYNRSEQAASMAQLVDSEKARFVSQRLNELQSRNIRPPVGRDFSNEFDETKVRLTINMVPDTRLSSYEELNIDTNEIVSLIQADINNYGNYGTIGDEMDRMHVYQDLYKRGFYISSGLKFGSDYLAYTGDPVDYHSKYAIRLVASDNTGHVDLDTTDFSEINCLQRLTHTANKIPLFTTVTLLPFVEDNASSTWDNNDNNNTTTTTTYDGHNNNNNKQIRYWTLKERVYLNPDSSNTDFDSVEPNCSNYPSTNKVRKTC